MTNGKTKSSKYEDFNSGNLEDAITKVMKLIANLSTEEKTATRDLQSVRDQQTLSEFFKSMMQAMASR